MAAPGTPAQRLATRLLWIRQAQIRASTALIKINAASEVICVETTVLREALYRIEKHADRAHCLLDKMETDAGLVDADGKRIDEVE